MSFLKEDKISNYYDKSEKRKKVIKTVSIGGIMKALDIGGKNSVNFLVKHKCRDKLEK